MENGKLKIEDNYLPPFSTPFPPLSTPNFQFSTFNFQLNKTWDYFHSHKK